MSCGGDSQTQPAPAPENAAQPDLPGSLKSASAPSSRWKPLFRDPTFGGTIGGDEIKKGKPTLKQSRSFVFEDEAEVLLSSSGPDGPTRRGGESMSGRLQAVWKIVVKSQDEPKQLQSPTLSEINVRPPLDGASPLPKIGTPTGSMKKLRRISTGSAFSNVSSVCGQPGLSFGRPSSSKETPVLQPRLSQDSRTSSVAELRRLSQRGSSKLSLDSRGQSQVPSRASLAPIAPLETDLVALSGEADRDSDSQSQASRSPMSTPNWHSEEAFRSSRSSPKGSPQGSEKGSRQGSPQGSPSLTEKFFQKSFQKSLEKSAEKALEKWPKLRGSQESNKLSLRRIEAKLREESRSPKSPKSPKLPEPGLEGGLRSLRAKSPAEKTLLEPQRAESSGRWHRLPSKDSSKGEGKGGPRAASVASLRGKVAALREAAATSETSESALLS